MQAAETKAIMENITQMVKFSYNHGAQDELNKIIKFLELDLVLEDTECMQQARDRIINLLKSRGSRHADHSYQVIRHTEE